MENPRNFKNLRGFAKQWLNHLGYELYNKDKRILEYNGKPNYPIKRLNTSIQAGVDFIEHPEEPQRITLREYRDLGLAICSRFAEKEERWHERQTRIYYIGRRTKTVIEPDDAVISRIGILIFHDPINKMVKIIGKYFGTSGGKFAGGDETPWMCYKKEAARGVIEYSSYTEAADSVRYPKEQKSEPVYIPEVPVMFSNDNFLVCIKKRPIVQKIMFVGATRGGKSFGTNATAGRVVYKFQDRIGMINDVLGQFYDLSLPAKDFILDLKRIGEEPKPLPTINLYLSTPNLMMRNEREGINFRMVQPFLEFLRKYSFYAYGIAEWKLDGKESYLQDMAEELVYSKNAVDLKDRLFDKFGQEGEKELEAKKSMIMKWFGKFSKIFAEEFTSNIHPDGLSELTLHRNGEVLKGHPFIIAMEAGLTPVINTAQAYHSSYFRNYLADLFNKIEQWQIVRGEKKKRIWIIADELNRIYEVGKKRKDNCTEGIENLFRAGAINQIGFIGNTQSYDGLHPQIRENLSHLFCVRIQRYAERKEIQKDYNLSKEETAQLANLKEREMIALSKEPWVFYDSYGKRREEERIFKGKIIPPISFHYTPKKKKLKFQQCVQKKEN